MKTILLDTGPIVASLDRDDPHHSLVCHGFQNLTGRPLTSAAVITEAMFFLQDVRDGPTHLVEWLRRMRVQVEDCFGFHDLQNATELMSRYADTPMDFADATLVLLAEQSRCGDILTLDERGFRTFRFQRNKTFHLLLQEEKDKA